MVALVTGAYKGLGLALCYQLAMNGYKVVLTARTQEKADEATQLLVLKGANEIFPKELDVTNESQLTEMAKWAKQTFGKLDLIINNAGINPKDYPDKSKMAKAFYLNELDPQELFQVIHINSIAPLLVTKHFRSLLKLSDKPIVINISSWLGSVSQLSFGAHYGYVGSKNLLNIFNRSMAFELKSDGITCINVNPGWVQTDMGGSKAQFTAEQAANNLYSNIIAKVKPSDSGRFMNYDGSDHPW